MFNIVLMSVSHVPVASFAVIQGESYRQMTGTTELSFKNILHLKVLGSFLLDVENVRVAVGTVVPLLMFFMRKIGGWDDGHLCLQREQLFEGHRFIVLIVETCCRPNSAKFRSFIPVDAITKSSLRQIAELFESFLTGLVYTTIVTLLAIIPGVAKGDIVIMAGAAKFTIKVAFLGDPTSVGLHYKAKLKMTDMTGVVTPVRPVRKRYRCLSFVGGQAIDQDVAIL